jgi:release factor glutamine methyltransferase
MIMQDEPGSVDAVTLSRLLKAINELPKEVYSPSDDSFLMLDAISSFQFTGKTTLDMGTGSGILGLFAALQGATVTVADVSEAAANHAAKAAHSLGVKVDAVVSNLFANIKGTFEVVLFNPPYLPSTATVDATTDGGRNGLEVIQKFLSELGDYLVKDGTAFLLLSSFNNPSSLLHKHPEFSSSVVRKLSLFFEELQVLKLRFRRVPGN